MGFKLSPKTMVGWSAVGQKSTLNLMACKKTLSPVLSTIFPVKPRLCMVSHIQEGGKGLSSLSIVETEDRCKLGTRPYYSTN